MEEEICGLLCSEVNFMGNPGLSQSEGGALSHPDSREAKAATL